MNEPDKDLERLIDGYGKKNIVYTKELKEVYDVYCYSSVNDAKDAKEQMLQAKQALLDYIEENYRRKDD